MFVSRQYLNYRDNYIKIEKLNKGSEFSALCVPYMCALEVARTYAFP